MVYRHSIVVEFFSTTVTKETPEPFVELRVTIYTAFPVPKFKMRKRLIDEVAKLAWVFYSIRIAVAEGKASWSIETTKEYTVLLPATKRMLVLTGLEFNVPVSVEEATEHIAMNVVPYFEFIARPRWYLEDVRRNFRKYLNYPIYNAIFYEPDGTVKRAFNNHEIRNYVAPQGAGFTRRSIFEGKVMLAEFEAWKKRFLEYGGMI